MQSRRILVFLALAAALGGASPGALAQKADREASATEGQLNEVGKGERLGRQGLKPGAFITPRHRKAVQAWLARNQGAGKPCLAGWARHGSRCVAPSGTPAWRIGVAVPSGARLDHVPPGLLASLPPAPPGNAYALVSGDIVLMASGSRIVVDAVPVR
ncbi:MAG TPA: hypothetical protein VLK85_24100 [Ramlibacter sp.]|nr:hypothetical protein [Ramlibacter sp.]